jgi:hypothetical protein
MAVLIRADEMFDLLGNGASPVGCQGSLFLEAGVLGREGPICAAASGLMAITNQSTGSSKGRNGIAHAISGFCRTAKLDRVAHV